MGSRGCSRIKDAEFFKVFLPHRSSHQLLIPTAFTKDFRRSMKEKVILKNMDGKTWYVDVEHTRDGVFLKDGWQSFVDYHGLKVGEFLVFRYDKGYTFVVKIFGTNGCMKEKFESENTATPAKLEEVNDEEMKPRTTSRKRAASQSEGPLSSGDKRSKRL